MKIKIPGAADREVTAQSTGLAKLVFLSGANKPRVVITPGEHGPCEAPADRLKK
jgi:hypothetical protein